ncbi:MAG: hypothetical protein ACK53T_15895 [Planctomycetota bacterium]|jgi:hypothetical protein
MTGQTSLHVYSAATLRSLGICTGSVLLNLEIAPSSAGLSPYNAPSARMQIGHLAVSPPTPGNWGGHLASPILVHDVTSGPYTFPWTVNAWVPLPGFAGCNFVWDGVSDIGIQYTSSSGVTGGFQVHRTATQLRHYVAVFGATTQAPTSNALLAMKVRMTWAAGQCASRVVYGAGCDTPALALDSNFPLLGSNFTMTVSNVPNVVPLALLFFGTAQAPGVDLGFLGAPGCSAWTNANLTSASLSAIAGSASATIAIPNNPLLQGVSFTTQAAAFTLANVLGLSTSNGLECKVGI